MLLLRKRKKGHGAVRVFLLLNMLLAAPAGRRGAGGRYGFAATKPQAGLLLLLLLLLLHGVAATAEGVRAAALRRIDIPRDL